MSDLRPDRLAIQARDVKKTYLKGRVQALNGISFEVAAGSIFALLGPNGAGKSTTVKVLTTQTRPDSGSATVAGADVVRQPDKVRRAIGYVSQKPQFDPEATGYENLYLQGRLYGMPRHELAVRVRQLLERFDLAHAASRAARSYSGGMQRKLDVALGLVHRPQVLFLDEPTTGLDPHARADMWQEISRLAREDGLTVLLTTHYLNEADQLADQVAIVDRGVVVVQGTPDELKQELRGDAIHIELAQSDADERLKLTLDKVEGLHEVSVDRASVRARVDHGARAVPSVLAAFETAGLPVASVTISRPSLDDVYLRYAGRPFEEASSTNGGLHTSDTHAVKEVAR
ncbi:MAG TPA: ATP-binding cassette domain-containing protein [Actinopolymorphaceae bacterium]